MMEMASTRKPGPEQENDGYILLKLDAKYVAMFSQLLLSACKWSSQETWLLRPFAAGNIKR